MKKSILSFLLAIAFITAFSQKKLSGPLDGKKFVITLIQNEKKEIPDEMNFSSGKCKTTYFANDWAFPAKPYEVTFVDSTDKEKKNYQFMWESTNDSGEKIALQGSVDGETIEGSAEVTSKSGRTLKSYTFTGNLKKKKVPGAK